MKTLTTSAALARIREPGAEAAWATLVERHGPDVWRLIASRQWDTHVAEDAYQEFWLHLPQAAKRFTPDPEDGERKAQAWMLAVAYRTAIDVHRRRKPAQAMTTEPTSTTEHDMEEHDEREHQLARVRSALDQLPEGYRQPVLLHLVGGLSYEDLAAELRCTVNNARVKVHRGLSKLRGLLGVDGAQLSEKTLAGMLVPPFLLAPPPAPALSAAVATPALPAGAVGAAGKTTLFTAIAKVPVLSAVAAATLAGTVTVTAVALHAPATPPVAPQEAPMPNLRPVAAAVAATALTATASGAVLDDFERDATLMDSVVAQHADLSLVPAPAGIGSGKALRIAWPKDHKTFVDCFYTKMIDAPAVTADGSAVATFKVWTEAFSGAAKLSIRFCDAKLETFQWGAELPNPGQAGWRIVSFPLIPAESKGHWGPPGQSDGIIDFPLRLNGYAVQFTGPDAPAGSLLIDDVTVAPATAPTTTTP